mmetsp:Transcript_36205/g.108457  ORF Transcript_36205/g.108457 Transcript_36205/m.108457 type:complete len:202 (-) Transcript_36205:807-1412(-)
MTDGDYELGFGKILLEEGKGVGSFQVLRTLVAVFDDRWRRGGRRLFGFVIGRVIEMRVVEQRDDVRGMAPGHVVHLPVVHPGLVGSLPQVVHQERRSSLGVSHDGEVQQERNVTNDFGIGVRPGEEGIQRGEEVGGGQGGGRIIRAHRLDLGLVGSASPRTHPRGGIVAVAVVVRAEDRHPDQPHSQQQHPQEQHRPHPRR